jgi:hypothetical protein
MDRVTIEQSWHFYEAIDPVDEPTAQDWYYYDDATFIQWAKNYLPGSDVSR